MEQRITTDLEIINNLLDEIVILYFSGNTLQDILMYLESKVGQELFEEVKKRMREVSLNGQ